MHLRVLRLHYLDTRIRLLQSPAEILGCTQTSDKDNRLVVVSKNRGIPKS